MKKAKFERKLWKRIDKVTEIIRRQYPTSDYWDISGFIDSERRNVYITDGITGKRVHEGDICRQNEEVEHNG